MWIDIVQGCALPFLVLIFAIGIACVFTFHSFKKVRKDFPSSTETALNQNHLRTWIVGGMMGSGKTTFARQLAEQLDMTHIEIDRYSSEKDALALIDAVNTGWVAEANPWQIPSPIVKQAAVVVFLDFDNAVNYIRLIKRGYTEWKAAGINLHNFKLCMVDRTVLDLCRIVFLYGRANRYGWRKAGMFREMNDSAIYIRCVSPAELDLLIDNLCHPST